MGNIAKVDIEKFDDIQSQAVLRLAKSILGFDEAISFVDDHQIYAPTDCIILQFY